MWAQFGKIGRDGKGIEYIFCKTNGNIPIKPDTTKVPGDDEFNS